MPSTPLASGHSFAFLRLMASMLADRDVRFVVAGATGWLGQATLDVLEFALGPRADERVIAFGSHGREIKLRSGRIVRVHALDNLSSLAKEKRYVFLHYAFLTRDKVGIYSHDDYVAGNAAITNSVGRAV